MTIRIIVAFDERRGIGHRGIIPWQIPEDMRLFRLTTTGHAVIMGRLTWESIGRPLPDRRNIVVSSTVPSLRGAEVVKSLEEAFNLTGRDAFVIGGQRIYEAALPLTDEILASQVIGVYPADVFFPEIDSLIWKGTCVRSYSAFDLWKYERRMADDRKRD